MRLLELNPGWQNQDLARCVKLDPSTVTRLLSPSKCVAEVVEALRENKIAISDAYEISKQEDREGQLRLLALKNAGASREVLAAQVRKQRAAATPAVRVSKIRCRLRWRTSSRCRATKSRWKRLSKLLVRPSRQMKAAVAKLERQDSDERVA